MWKNRIKWLLWLLLGLVIITRLFSSPWVYVTLSLFWAFIIWGAADREGVL